MAEIHSPFSSPADGEPPSGPGTSSHAGIAVPDAEIMERITDYRSHLTGFGRLMRYPLKVILEKPTNILYVSIPLALVIFFAGTAMTIQGRGIGVILTSTAIDDVILVTLLVALIPLVITQFRESRRVNSLENALPNFFRDLAGMNDSGMTLPNAVHLVAMGEYGKLTPHIRKMDAEMSWNVPFVEAIYRFGRELGTPLAARSVDLIAKASRAGGDASEVLRAAAVDTYEIINLKTERQNNMLIYVIIVLISFFVFVFVIFILVTTFLTTMATAGAAAAAAGSGTAFVKGVDVPFYTRIFSHAAMIQGFFSGLVAGQMGEGDAVAGFKYSVAMVIIAWVMFRFFV